MEGGRESSSDEQKDEKEWRNKGIEVITHWGKEIKGVEDVWWMHEPIDAMDEKGLDESDLDRAAVWEFEGVLDWVERD